MDCETGRGGDNGFLYICLMTGSGKKKVPTPTPSLPKGTWKCKQYKEGNFDISSDGAGGVGVMNLGSQLCFFRTLAK